MTARSGGGFTCCVPGCFTNSKRDTHLSFYVFPKEKNLRRRWLHSISIFYTGLTFGQFVALFNFLNAHGICYRLNYWGSDYAKLQLPDIEKKGQKHFLEADDELFLTSCRLRFNIPEKVLADNYNISVSEVSSIFATWLDLPFSRLIQLPVWATRRTVEETMPEVSRQKYPLTRVVLDCTELFIEKPSCFRAQSETYSSYKSHNTAKGLVAIAPNGALTFVSDLYGGHCSDSYC